MSISLYKFRSAWIVKQDDKTFENFTTIEDASDFLEGIGVPDEEIDTALIELDANKHTHAVFGLTNKTFVFSNEDKFNELFGVA